MCYVQYRVTLFLKNELFLEVVNMYWEVSEQLVERFPYVIFVLWTAVPMLLVPCKTLNPVMFHCGSRFMTVSLYVQLL